MQRNTNENHSFFQQIVRLIIADRNSNSFYEIRGKFIEKTSVYDKEKLSFLRTQWFVNAFSVLAKARKSIWACQLVLQVNGENPFQWCVAVFPFKLEERERERWISWLKLSTSSVSTTTSCVIECGETVCVGTQAHIHVGRTKQPKTTIAVSAISSSMGPLIQARTYNQKWTLHILNSVSDVALFITELMNKMTSQTWL